MPRFGFGGVRRNVADACVLIQHRRHVYWRLDFDMEPSTDTVFKEYDSPAACQGVNIEKQLQKKQGTLLAPALVTTFNYMQDHIMIGLTHIHPIVRQRIFIPAYVTRGRSNTTRRNSTTVTVL